MSETFVRSVVRELAESNRPSNLDLWPAIRDKVQTGYLEDKTAFLSRDAVSESPQPLATTESRVRRTPLLSMSRVRINLAMALVGLLGLTVLSIVLTIGVRPYVTSPQQSENKFVPDGSVRHVVISYTISFDDLLAKGATPTPPSGYNYEQQHTVDLWYTNG